MKLLEKYGVASGEFETANDAASHTYMKNDGSLPSTELIFPTNPFNDSVQKAKSVLDLGCGIGRNLEWIMLNTDAHYYGLDPNKSMLLHFWNIQDSKWADRVTLVSSFDQLPDIKLDIVVCTFVFQHIGYRTSDEQMNVTDITLEALKHCHDETVWIMYEHDWEEKWLERWFDDVKCVPVVYDRDSTAIPNLFDRGAHHLIIWKVGNNEIN